MIAAPKQTKLLGATVSGVGLVVAVSTTLTYCYTVIEGSDKINRRVALIDLKRDEVVFPEVPQPYRTQTERVGVGTWDEVYALLPIAHDRPIMALIGQAEYPTPRAA